MPTKPTQMLLLFLHDSAALMSAADAFVFGENQVAVDQVIPLEAALDVPAAIVGRDPPSQVPDGGEAGGEHAEGPSCPTVVVHPGPHDLATPAAFPAPLTQKFAGPTVTYVGALRVVGDPTWTS